MALSFTIVTLLLIIGILAIIAVRSRQRIKDLSRTNLALNNDVFKLHQEVVDARDSEEILRKLSGHFAYTLHHTGQDLKHLNWSKEKFEKDHVFAGSLVEEIGCLIQNRLTQTGPTFSLSQPELDPLSNFELVTIAGYLMSGWSYETIPLVVELRTDAGTLRKEIAINGVG